MKRALSVILALVLIAAMSVPALARWSGTNYVITDLSISSAGRANVSVEYALYSGYKVNMTVTLQKQNGTSWSSNSTWTANGSGVVTLDKSVYVSSGSYRLKVVGEVYTTSGSYVETVEYYSSIKSY